MKKFIQTLKNKINKPLVTFLGAVAILVLVSNMETATVEKAKKSVNQTVNKISEQLNSAANGDDSHPKKSTDNVANEKNITTNINEKKPVIAKEPIVDAQQKNIKSNNAEPIVKQNKTVDDKNLSDNGQNLLDANISMN